MIPQSYRSPVPGVALPSLTATKSDTLDALDGQTAQLDKANGRTADVVEIGDRCDKLKDELVKALQPKPPRWQFWRR